MCTKCKEFFNPIKVLNDKIILKNLQRDICEQETKQKFFKDLSSQSSSRKVSVIFKWQKNLYINARKLNYFKTKLFKLATLNLVFYFTVQKAHEVAKIINNQPPHDELEKTFETMRNLPKEKRAFFKWESCIPRLTICFYFYHT